MFEKRTRQITHTYPSARSYARLKLGDGCIDSLGKMGRNDQAIQGQQKKSACMVFRARIEKVVKNKVVKTHYYNIIKKCNIKV